MLPTNIFNTQKSDYDKPDLYLGEAPGLLDSVNSHHTVLDDLYKELVTQDWTPNEFSFAPCLEEFKTYPKEMTDRMINTLGYQWETDTVVARTLVPITAPFITNSTLGILVGRIGDNENVHGLTYSEVVKYSFDNPSEVLAQILKMQESLERLALVSEVFNKVYRISHEYAMGLRENNQETYNAIFLFTAAMLILERIQFMASFAITFQFGSNNQFIPICQAVQRIAQDEFYIHIQTWKYVIANELNTLRGQRAMAEMKDTIYKLISEVRLAEHRWTNWMLPEGVRHFDITAKMLMEFTDHSVGDVYDALQLKPEFTVPKHQQLYYMNDWIDVSKTQASPQEQQTGQYRVNLRKNDDQGKIFQLGLELY